MLSAGGKQCGSQLLTPYPSGHSLGFFLNDLGWACILVGGPVILQAIILLLPDQEGRFCGGVVCQLRRVWEGVVQHMGVLYPASDPLTYLSGHQMEPSRTLKE